jgi:PspA-Associated protein
VIVRIMGEGQWRVGDDLAARLDQLDAGTEQALDAGDQQALTAALKALADEVRTHGERLPDDDLAASDAVVPPVDLTLDEARELIHGEGLIPDLL